MALRGRAGAHPGNCGRLVLARSPGHTCNGRSLGGSRTSRASRDCPRHTRSHLRQRRLISDSAPLHNALCRRGESPPPGMGDLYSREAPPSRQLSRPIALPSACPTSTRPHIGGNSGTGRFYWPPKSRPLSYSGPRSQPHRGRPRPPGCGSQVDRQCT